MPEPHVRPITVQHEATCLSCDAPVEVGERAYWCQGVGIWHTGCPRPRNLPVYVAEAERRAALQHPLERGRRR